MPEIVITVANKEKLDKGGFKITDTLGDEYILSVKNAGLENQLVIGRAATITPFKSTYGVFINSAELFDGKPPEDKQVEKITAGVGVEQQKAYAPQEVGMWWKELGECIRAGNIEVDFPQSAVSIRSQYYKKMFGITGIKTKED